jgi:hypothetical protein
MWSSIVSALLSKVAPKVADYYIQKVKLKQEVELEKLRGKAAWQAALTERASESEGRDHEWELAMIENSGWKDEWVLMLISVPLIGVFLTPTQKGVLEGFNILSQTPLWYQTMVVTIFFAVYGIRKWRRKTQADVLLNNSIT